MLSSLIVVTGLKLMKTLQDTIRRGAPGRRDLTEAFIFLLNHPGNIGSGECMLAEASP